MSFLNIFGYSNESEPFLTSGKKKMESINNKTVEELQKIAKEIYIKLENNSISNIDFDWYIGNYPDVFFVNIENNYSTTNLFEYMLRKLKTMEKMEDVKILKSAIIKTSIFIKDKTSFYLVDIFSCKHFTRDEKFGFINFFDMNGTDINGNIILYYYCSKDYLEDIIEAGIDLNIKDENGNTFLHGWLNLNKTEIITEQNLKLIVKYGYDFSAKNNDGEDIFLIALEQELYDALLLLLKHGIDNRYYYFDKLIEIGKDEYCNKVIKFLEKEDFDFSLKINDEMDPFTFALYKGNFQFATSLLKKDCISFDNPEWIKYLCLNFGRNKIVEVINTIMKKDKLPKYTLSIIFEIHFNNIQLFYNTYSFM